MAKRTKPTEPAPAKEEGETSEPNASRAHTQESAKSLTLAPLATDKGILEALAARYTPESLVDELDALAKATTRYVTKSGNVHDKPEWGVRAKAAELKLAYLIGRPVERQEIITRSAPTTLDDLMTKAAESPVFRDTLIDMLQALTQQQAGVIVPAETREEKTL